MRKCSKISIVVTDLEACQLSGGLTNAQILNASVINSLHQLHSGINLVLPNLNNPPASAVEMIQASLQNIVSLMDITVNLLLDAVQSSLENKIARIHVEDFSTNSPLRQANTPSDAPCSTYIKDIMEFISRIQSDYFTMYDCKDFLLERLQPVAGRLLVLFVRHACLLRSISETGKLKLAADMAQLEFAVAPLCKRISDLGYAYKLLRAFRPLLFQSMEEIGSNPALGDTLPYSTVMHFIFSMAPPELKSPHTVAGWTISEYSAWLDEHPEEEKRLALIRGTLEAYAQNVSQGNKQPTEVYQIMTKLLDKANA